MKSNIARILDSFLVGTAVFLFAFLLARFYISELYLVLIVACSITMGVLMPLNFRNKKLRTAALESQAAEAASAHFLFKDEAYSLDFFYEALKKRYTVVKERYFLKINSTIVVPHFIEPLMLKHIVRYYAEAGRQEAKTLVILAPVSEKNIIGAEKRLPAVRLEFFKADKIYRLLKSLNSVPDPDPRVRRSAKIKEFLKIALTPKRAKNYLFVFFTLIIGAYFFSFGLYFIIMSGAALALAILAKLNLAERIENK